MHKGSNSRSEQSRYADVQAGRSVKKAEAAAPCQKMASLQPSRSRQSRGKAPLSMDAQQKRQQSLKRQHAAMSWRLTWANAQMPLQQSVQQQPRIKSHRMMLQTAGPLVQEPPSKHRGPLQDQGMKLLRRRMLSQLGGRVRPCPRRLMQGQLGRPQSGRPQAESGRRGACRRAGAGLQRRWIRRVGGPLNHSCGWGSPRHSWRTPAAWDPSGDLRTWGTWELPLTSM